ncbi:MAG: hypothetical protein VZQ62_01065 [Methanosphaera sp.]|nr:hypothetical protein [Methanosphaera sp.]
MKNYLRPLDNRFTINGVAMPRPHLFKTRRQPITKDASRDINTGALIYKKIGNPLETTWKWKKIRDDQLILVYNAIQTETGLFTITTIDSRKSSGSNLVTTTYDSYEPDDFDPDYFDDGVYPDGHRYYSDVEIHLTSIKAKGLT